MAQATDETLLVIDNDILTHWRNDHEYVTRHLDDYFGRHRQYPALTSVTAFESLRGFRRDADGQIESGQADHFNRLQDLVNVAPILADLVIVVSVFVLDHLLIEERIRQLRFPDDCEE